MHEPRIIELKIGQHMVSTDPLRVDVDVVYEYLHNHAYWAVGRARHVVESSVANSALVAGLYDQHGEMVGFARAVTDLATFAWICDVFVLDGHRGHGLGVALVETMVTHPALAPIKRQLLATRDAHGLYARMGFAPLDDPSKWMARPGPAP